MCKITPTELITAIVDEYRAGIAAEQAERERERASKATAKGRSAAGPQRSRSDNRVKRCRAYLAKLPPSVEGQSGSDRIFEAARIIWADFEIDEAEGYGLLEEYNQRSNPPWEEEGSQGLRRKWNEAVKAGGPRGEKLKDRDGWKSEPHARVSPSATPAESATTTDGEDSATPPATATGRPDIIHNQRQYRDVEASAGAALAKANDPTFVYVGNGTGLVDLVRKKKGDPLIARELTPAALRGVFGRVANWYKVVPTKGGEKLVEDYPPYALLTSFPERGDWPGIPHLHSVVTYPVYAPDWVMVTSDGYHPSSGIYCDLGTLAVPAAPERPSPGEVAMARDLIVNDLLVDFMFIDQSSRANAFGMLILPLIRHAIDGPTPIAVIDAPTEGTGKSLLAEACVMTTVGEVPHAISPDVSEEEWNKMLLAMLIEGSPVVYLDNANRKLDSASLASTITARHKRGRILGSTQMANARVEVSWLLTSNNFTCSREIARRCYWSRIDSGLENPSGREGFKHTDLHKWIRENRPAMLHALITLVNNWLALGKPDGRKTLGKFELWSKAVGGILDAAGVDGFLGNITEFRELCADQVSEMPEFVRKWNEEFGPKPMTAGQLYLTAMEYLESVLTAETEDGRRKQLGRHLNKSRDRVFGEFRLVAAKRSDGSEDKDHSGRQRFCLKPVKTGVRPTPSKTVPDAEGDVDGGMFEMRA